MDAFLDWLRYGLFGREALRIVNDYDAGALRMIILIGCVALLLLIIFMTLYDKRVAVGLAVAFVLCFGYVMGLGMAIVGLIIGVVILILGGEKPPTGETGGRTTNEPREERPSSLDVSFQTSDLARKVIACSGYVDAGAFQRELSELEVKARFNNLTWRELNNFVYKWDAAVSRHSDCWD